jgi:hypothetical protein
VKAKEHVRFKKTDHKIQPRALDWLTDWMCTIDENFPHCIIKYIRSLFFMAFLWLYGCNLPMRGSALFAPYTYKLVTHGDVWRVRWMVYLTRKYTVDTPTWRVNILLICWRVNCVFWRPVHHRYRDKDWIDFNYDISYYITYLYINWTWL